MKRKDSSSKKTAANPESRLVRLADKADAIWDGRPMTPEAVSRRRVAGTIGAVILAGAFGLGAYEAGKSAGRDEVNRDVLVTGHRKAQIGGIYDHDGDPATPDKRIGTLSELANAARVPGMSSEDVLGDLRQQLDTMDMKAGEIPEGTAFTLPASAEIGSPVPDDRAR